MDATDSRFVYIVLAEKRGTNRMADLEDDKKDKKLPESRWHQCPRCSFWFDCLTEPSFANRPDEVPPTSSGPGMLNIKQEAGYLAGPSVLGTSFDSSDGSEFKETEAVTDQLKPPHPLGELAAFLEPNPFIKQFANSSMATKDEQDVRNNIENDDRLVSKPTRTLANIKKSSKTKAAVKRKMAEKPVSKIKIRSVCKEFTFSGKEKYLFNGMEISRDELQNYSKVKECTSCGKFVVNTQLHLLNFHSEEQGEVTFNVTDEKEEDTINPSSDTPECVALAKEKGQRPPKKCSVCQKWVVNLNRHMIMHKDMLFSSEKRFEEKYFFDNKLIPASDLDQYSRWKECSLCGEFVLDPQTHFSHVHSDIKAQEISFAVYEKKYEAGIEMADTSTDQESASPGKKGKLRTTCTICNKSVLNIEKHMKTRHENKLFPCEKCNKKFTSEKKLEIHKCPLDPEVMAERERENLEQVQCNVCQEMVGKLDLNKHIKDNHTEEKSFPCSLCPAVFKDNRGLKFHSEKHSGNVEKCPICDRVFQGKMLLKRHIKRTHNMAERYHCNQCEKSYKNKQGLQTHIDMVHSGIDRESARVHECDICLKRFFTKGSVVVHKMQVHEAQKAFQCDQCPKSFCMKGGLKSHFLLVHSGLRPFNCETCGKTYKTKAQLDDHKIVAHTTEKGSLCPICGQAFALRKLMVSHLKRIHEHCDPVFCEYPGCGRALKDKHSLSKHMRKVHIQPLCQECNIMFLTLQEFHVHMKNHAGLEVHPCPVCQKVFHQRHLMVNHMKSHRDINVLPVHTGPSVNVPQSHPVVSVHSGQFM